MLSLLVVSRFLRQDIDAQWKDRPTNEKEEDPIRPCEFALGVQRNTDVRRIVQSIRHSAISRGIAGQSAYQFRRQFTVWERKVA